MQLIRKIVIAFLVITVFASSNYILNDNADYQKASAASFYYDKYSLTPGYTYTISDSIRYGNGRPEYDSLVRTSGPNDFIVDNQGEVTLSGWHDGYKDYDFTKNWSTYVKISNSKLKVTSHSGYYCDVDWWNGGTYCSGGSFTVSTATISKKGSLIESNVIKDDSYPEDGAKDGYWWVRNGPANQAPSLTMLTANNQVLS